MRAILQPWKIIYNLKATPTHFHNDTTSKKATLRRGRRESFPQSIVDDDL